MLTTRLKRIEAQMRSDCHSVMLGLATQRDALNGALDRFEEALEAFRREARGSLGAGESAVEQYVRLTESRFGELLEATGEWASELDDVRARVQRLEEGTT